MMVKVFGMIVLWMSMVVRCACWDRLDDMGQEDEK